MPNIARLMARGTVASVTTTFPPLTAAAWGAIATGAGPGTAGIPSLMVHLPGEPLDKWHTSFDRRILQAETLWEAGQRAGKRPILVNWPVTFPIGLQDGVQIAAALNPPFRFFYMPLWDVASSSLFSTERHRCNQVPGRAVVVEPRPASGWQNLPPSSRPPLEIDVLVPPTYVPGIPYHVVIVAGGDGGYDRVLISPGKDARQAVACLSVGQMSDWLTETFQTDQGARRGRFRFQLLRLAPDASELRIYASAINTAEPYTFPPEITPAVEAAAGPYMEVDDPWLYMDGWADLEVYLDQLDAHARWWANATRYALENHRWDMAFTWVGTIDHMQHVMYGAIEPRSWHYDPAQAGTWLGHLRRVYRAVDSAAGRILEAVDLDDTLVLVVSDHGFTHLDLNPYIKHLLAKAGLLSFSLHPQTGELIVDWSRTRCYPLEPGHAHIFVNLKGRDPHGIVEPEDYARVQEEIIDALLAIRDPRTGERIMHAVIRRQEAATLGVFANQGYERIGDVLFALKPGYCCNPFVYSSEVKYFDGTRRTIPNPEDFEPDILGHHFTGIHLCLPTVEDMQAAMILAGPGVRRQERRQPVNIVDIAPTLAFILGTPIPKDAEGGILHDVVVSLTDRA